MPGEFLETGHDNLSQVTLVETIGDLDDLIQLAFAQRTCDGGSKLTRLLAGAVVGDQAIDHDADGPGRHHEQHDHYDSCRPSHHAPHAHQIEIHSGLIPLID